MRNPLGVAQGYLELAREGDDEAFDRVDGALARIEEMVGDLSAIARGESLAADVDRVAFEPMVHAAWRTAATARAGLTVADDLGEIRCVETRLRHLLENLFRNAVVHAATDDGTVSVTVGRLDSGGFYVADDGPGIPASDREAVFERGYSTADRGTGFGLVVVRDVAEAHDWSVGICESADGGARFEFTDVDVRE